MLEINKIYCMDCIEFMKQLPNGCIDLIVTSPPYNIGTGQGENWRVKSWYFDSLPEQEYQKWQRNACLEMLRISKVVCYNHKIRNRKLRAIHPMQWIPSEYLYQEVIWNQKRTPQLNRCYFHPVDERIYIMALDPRGIMLNNGNYKTIWTIQSNQRTAFPIPNTIPDELISRCINAFTHQGGLVFDPFLGCGSTVVVAKRLNRNFLGCDVNSEYIEVADKRLKNIDEKK